MKQITVKRLLALLMLLVLPLTAARAQADLQVAELFERYGHAKGCKMVVLNNTTLRGFHLNVYRSLVYKHLAAEASACLKTDRKRARKIREVIEDGQVVSGYYLMPQLQKDVNRYVLFSNGKGESGAVIYIEGPLSPDDIMKLCYTKRK